MGIAGLINKQSRKQDIETALHDAIMSAVRVQNPPSRSTKANIKPSKSQCLRQMYYILTLAPANQLSTTDPKLTMIQKLGTYIHQMLQETMYKGTPQGIVFRKPEEVVESARKKGLNTSVVPTEHSRDNPYECHCYNSDYDISFMFDGALEFMDETPLIEIKSEDHFKWMKRIAPDPEHIDQATNYSICLGLNTVLFLYVDRNYLEIKPYKILITDEMRSSVTDKIAGVKKDVAGGILPEATKCKACKYCDYTRICKTNFNPVNRTNEVAE